MNILMIGNGFDLEHDLPTKYTDFLKFIKDFNQAYYSPSNEAAICEFENTYFLNFIKTHRNIYKRTEIINALRKLIYRNLWLNYFIKIHDEHLFQKENWIDFESEISSIVQTMEQLIKYYENYRLTGVEDRALHNFYLDTLTKFIDEESLKMDNIQSCIQPMIFDLNRLICALEIYIAYYINYIKIQYYSPDILFNSFDKVISFNYSDTYSRLYTVTYDDADYHFIHGRMSPALSLSWYMLPDLEKNSNSLESYMSHNNMVLGIDEYLPDDRKDKEVDFLTFKKYYQRIYKNTTSQYKDWLKEIDANPESNEQNTLHIFGHSLDVTDGDILRELINHKGIKTIIYYKTKQQLGQQITNLVKVLGSNAVIEKVYGSNSSITFKVQSERCKTDNNLFKICIDIASLKNIHISFKAGAEHLLSKISKNIDQKNLSYFYSQGMIITLFDALQRIGLGAKYFDKLLEIVYALDKHSFFDYQSWAYMHYDHSFKCDVDTTRFIDCVNEHNSNAASEASMTGFASYKYVHISHQKINLDKTQYLEIVNDIFENIDKLSYDSSWHLLVQISCGPAKETAREAIQELIDGTDNDYDIIQYNHLLQLMDAYEYANKD